MALIKMLAFVLLLGILQAPRTADISPLPDRDLKTSTISLSRKGCFGACPIYTVTIHGDGRVQYSGKKYVKVAGEQQGFMPPETIRTLFDEFETAKFFSIADQYSQAHCACKRRCTDMPAAVLELSLKGNTHRINHYYGCGCAPRILFDLERTVDKAANIEKWTGDTSQTGPLGTTCMETP